VGAGDPIKRGRKKHVVKVGTGGACGRLIRQIGSQAPISRNVTGKRKEGWGGLGGAQCGPDARMLRKSGGFYKTWAMVYCRGLGKEAGRAGGRDQEWKE